MAYTSPRSLADMTPWGGGAPGRSVGPRLVRSAAPPSGWPAATIAFGEFRLDTLRRRLIHDGEITQLPERLFGVLSLLVRSNGAIVDKETFATVVWPDVVMTDANLAQHVYQLRRLLKETVRDGSSIVAASGRGYRFAIPVFVEPAPSDASVASFERRSPRSSNDLEAVVYHVQGSHLLEHDTAEALKRAIEFFAAALEIDREYSPALLGFARAHALLAERWFIPPVPGFRTAREALTRVLELSPDSAIAHAMQAELLALTQWNWTGARRELDVAAQLDPESTFVRNSAARLCIWSGSCDRAMFEALALAGEPRSLTLLLLFVDVFVHSGRYTQAIAILSNLLAMDPNCSIARRYRALAYLLDGRPTDAILDLHMLAPQRLGDLNGRLPLLARAYADSGDRGRAEELYSLLLTAARADYVTYWSLAIVAAGLAKLDEAMGHLEEALLSREPTLHLLKSLPWFKPVSHLARFQEILRIVG